MSSTGCSTNTSTPRRVSRLTSASPTPPWSGITATRVPAPKSTPVGTQASRSGRSAGTGTRRGIRSVAAMSPLTVGVAAAALEVPPRLFRSVLGWGCLGAGLVADPADDVGEGGEVAQFEVVVAGDAVVLADGGEDLGLFDGVHAEVGFQVEVDVEQLGGVSGELGDNAHHGVGHLVAGRGRRCRGRAPGPPRGAALGAGVGAGVPVLSRIQPTTWVRVGKSRSLRLSSRATP